MSKNILLVLLVVTGVAGYSGYVLGVNRASMDKVAEELLQEKDYSSEAVIQIAPFGAGVTKVDGSVLLTRQFVETQIQMIKSDETVKLAVQDYDLANLLGLKEADLIEEVASSIEVRQERGTDLLSVKARGASKLNAEQLCFAVVNTYGKRREGDRKSNIEVSKRQFVEKRKEQEDKVEDERARLYALSKKLQIPYYGKNGRVLVDESKVESEETVQHSPESMTLFGKVREDYERELGILDAIKMAEFTELVGGGLLRDLVIIHKSGWSDEVAEEMKLGE